MRNLLLTSVVAVICAAGCSERGTNEPAPDADCPKQETCDCDTGVVSLCAGEPPECSVDDDCPGMSPVPFLQPIGTRCIVSLNEGWHCSECIHDIECEPGWACRDTTYCEALGPCETGDECAGVSGAVHDACIDGQCSPCSGDSDCAVDEVCLDRRCADRDRVDERCVTGACTGACEVQYDFAGRATGIVCLGET